MPLRPRGPLQVGEMVLLVDRKHRRYLIDLSSNGEFHTHCGVLRHDEIIGSREGSSLKSSRGMSFVAFRPTVADFVLKMPRGAQVIYPKDIGPLLLLADIFPGVRVFESGLGSGALSTAMLQAGADITGYEIREDFLVKAIANVSRFLGNEILARYKTSQRNSYEGISENDFDRVVLDLPEPWQVVSHAEKALRPGGLFVAYTPSIMQVSQLHKHLENSRFGLAQTIEVLNRGWHVVDQAVRPNHRMVAHTGFLTSARLFSD